MGKTCVMPPKKRFFLLDKLAKNPGPIKNYGIAGHPAVSG
jgi:hypothetical protein